MKISEMTLEQLQDYALNLENEKQALKDENAQHTAKIGELTELNTTLQKRNNDLFMKVEQGLPGSPQPQEPEKIKSCEDFAKSLLEDKRI